MVSKPEQAGKGQSPRGKRSGKHRARKDCRKSNRTGATNGRLEPQRRHAKGASERSISRRRLWLFRASALTITPVVILLVLEIGLRVGGYGFTATPSITCRLDHRLHYCDNIQFGWRFFPRHIAREFDPFTFPATKSDDTYRVFVLGGSAAQGTPDPAFGFPRILNVMLRKRCPGTHFEVVTLAMPAINSHVVREIAKDCARHKPDLFIVYLGNNEVVGPYGAGTVFGRFSSHLSLIRASIALKTTRLGQLINRFLEACQKDGVAQRWGGMRMFLQKQVGKQDPRLAKVYRHFRENLQDICRIGADGGAAVVLCTVGANVKDCPPFAALHRPDLTDDDRSAWDRIYEQGIRHEKECEHAAALATYLKAVDIDDTHSDLQFRIGRCCWAMGKYDPARKRYEKARELDTLRFRADAEINHIIRHVARGNGNTVLLVDAEKVLQAHSPHGVPGQELFHDHVHLNFSGNYLLAEAILQRVSAMLGGDTRGQDGRTLLTQADCARHLAYTAYEKYRISHSVLHDYIGKPPFTDQLYHEDQVRELKQTVKNLKASLAQQDSSDVDGQYRDAIRMDPGDWWLRWKYAYFLTEHMKDHRAAARHYRIVKESLPHFPYAYVRLALVLARLGRHAESPELSIQALKIKRRIPGAYFNLGLTYQKEGQVDRCIECYLKALALKPDHKTARNNLVRALCRQQRFDEAERLCRQGLLHHREDPVFHRNLAVCLLGQGRTTQAVTELRTALRLDPNSTQTQAILRGLHAEP